MAYYPLRNGIQVPRNRSFSLDNLLQAARQSAKRHAVPARHYALRTLALGRQLCVSPFCGLADSRKPASSEGAARPIKSPLTRAALC